MKRHLRPVREKSSRLHTVQEDSWFIENVILRDCAVTLAENERGMVAFLARQGEEVRLLDVHPDHLGRARAPR